MNRRPLRPCKYYGCPNLTRDKSGYCGSHLYIQEEKERQRQKHYNAYSRDKKNQSFYNSKDWIKIRNHTLTLYNGIDIYTYYADEEIVIANTVHHVVELKEDWDKRLDIENLMPVSEGSHREIHQLYLEDREGTQKLLFDMLERYKKEFNIYPPTL